MLAHIGAPRAAWLPLDENSPHYFYYSLYPQYHVYNDPSIPPWEDIMAARDRWLERNSDLTVVGAHLGSMAHDVDEVARRLNQYPNFSVETAARFGDLATQDSDKVREFFIKYQDRVLYGTDLLTVGPGAEITEAQREELRMGTVNALPLHWRYLTGSGELHYKAPWGSFNTTTRALALPREVIEKVYHDNAVRMLDLE